MAPASTAIYPLSLHDALPICHFEAALGDAQRPRTVLEAADIEPLLPEPHAFAFRADAVARWYAHVLEHDFPGLVAHHGLIAGAELHARRVHVHDETGDASARALGAIGRDHKLHEICLAGAGDKSLDPVDHVVLAVAHSGSAHAARIGSGIGLGLSEAGLFLAAQQRQQVFLLHLTLE